MNEEQMKARGIERWEEGGQRITTVWDVGAEEICMVTSTWRIVWP